MTTQQIEGTRAIDALHEQMIRAAAAGESALDALVETSYADDARFLPPNHSMVSSKASIRDYLVGMLAGGHMDLALRPVAQSTSGELAYENGTYQLIVHPASGGAISDNGKYLEVHRRQADGSWKCVADMFNSGQPAP